MKWKEIIKDIRDLQIFTELSRTIVSASVNAEEEIDLHRRMNRALNLPDPYPTEESRKEPLRDAKERQIFARREVEQRFRYVHSLTVVKLWSILEATIGDFILECVTQKSNWLKKDVLGKIKGPLLEFVNANEDERAAFLVQQLRSEVQASLKPGVGRFESMLDAIGLGGPVNEHVKRALLELAETRNVIVHRRGIADRQFVRRCPWVGAMVGEPIVLLPIHLALFQSSVIWYLAEIERRESVASNIELDKANRDFMSDLESDITKQSTCRPARITLFPSDGEDQRQKPLSPGTTTADIND